jgi:photosystem II stability/assembly factor-like uncharacterized protein
MCKRLYITILTATIIALGTSHAQWIKEDCPTTDDLNSVSFVSQYSGWVVGDNGTILFKIGSKWIKMASPSSEDLNSVYMVSRNDGWAVGANGTIIRFDGSKWDKMESPTKNDLYSVSFRDSENGIAVGDFGTILICKSGKWSLQGNNIRGNLYSSFYSESEAWIGGGLECVNVPIISIKPNTSSALSTTRFDSFATINGIYFTSQHKGWAVGSPSALLRFDGQQWIHENIIDNFSSLLSVSFASEEKGISVGYGGTVLVYDEGIWKRENSSVNVNLRNCTYSNDIYYAVGEKGTIISRKINDNLNNDRIADGDNGNIEIFPVPCDNHLNISFNDRSISESDLIVISNSNGQTVKQISPFTGTGTFSFQIETSDFENGIYFLRLKTDFGSHNMKFIVNH